MQFNSREVVSSGACAFRLFAFSAVIISLNATLSAQAFELTRLIGRGFEGEVYSAREFGASDDTLAVKVMKENTKEYSNLVDIEEKTAAVPEQQRHLVLRARNYATEQHNVRLPSGERAARAIVFPLFKGGSLRMLLLEATDHPRSHPITQTSLLSISKSILNGLKLLHQTAGYVHGDIKPSNILLQLTNNGIISASIADFGLASPINQDTITALGTMGYYPPEYSKPVPEARNRRPARRTAAFDVFSFGSVLYQLATGKYVNPLTLRTLQSECWKDPEAFAGDLPQALRSIVVCCWNVDPHERPTVDQILEALDVYAQDQIRSSTILQRVTTCFSGK